MPKGDYPEERPYTKKKPPVGSGTLRKAVDAIMGRKKRVDDAVDKQSKGKKK